MDELLLYRIIFDRFSFIKTLIFTFFYGQLLVHDQLLLFHGEY